MFDEEGVLERSAVGRVIELDREERKLRPSLVVPGFADEDVKLTWLVCRAGGGADGVPGTGDRLSPEPVKGFGVGVVPVLPVPPPPTARPEAAGRGEA